MRAEMDDLKKAKKKAHRVEQSDDDEDDSDPDKMPAESEEEDEDVSTAVLQPSVRLLQWFVMCAVDSLSRSGRIRLHR